MAKGSDIHFKPLNGHSGFGLCRRQETSWRALQQSRFLGSNRSPWTLALSRRCDLECEGKKEAVWTLSLTAAVRLWDTSRLGQTLFV